MTRLMICLALILSIIAAGSAWGSSDCTTFVPHDTVGNYYRFPKAEPDAPRPAYLIPTHVDRRLNSVVTRIAGDSGLAIHNVSSSMWGNDSRHSYTKRQAWNADGTLLYIENGKCTNCDDMPGNTTYCSSGSAYNGPAEPTKVFLDGNTYIPQDVGQGTNVGNLKELLWHPSASYADYVIGVADSTDTSYTTLMWVNVETDAILRRWTVPISFGRMGPFEGGPSNDGRYIALVGKNGTNKIVVVDMDPQSPWTTYGSGGRRIGTSMTLPSCGLCTSGNPCVIGPQGYASVSSYGTYLVVAYAGDFQRVFTIDWSTATPSIPTTPRSLSMSPGCYSGSSELTGSNGWLMPLKHTDYLVYGGAEYVLGIDKCYATSGNCAAASDIEDAAEDSGRVVMASLSTGSVRHISGGNLNDPAGANEQTVHHVAARNIDGLTDWVFASYEKTTMARLTHHPFRHG